MRRTNGRQRQPSGQTSKSTTMHTASRALPRHLRSAHARTRSLSLLRALSRPNETERRLARRSLSHWLPAYTKICSEQFSLKSSLAEFTSHQSRPARHAAVAQPNNKRLTTVEVEAAVDAQVEVAAEQQQSKANANANYTRRKRKFTASPAHLCVCVSLFLRVCVCVFLVACPVSLLSLRFASSRLTFYVSFRVSFSRVCLTIVFVRKQN